METSNHRVFPLLPSHAACPSILLHKLAFSDTAHPPPPINPHMACPLDYCGPKQPCTILLHCMFVARTAIVCWQDGNTIICWFYFTWSAWGALVLTFLWVVQWFKFVVGKKWIWGSRSCVLNTVVYIFFLIVDFK